ncbi:hypothetical protein [Dactylosporangium sp. NPDC051541]
MNKKTLLFVASAGGAAIAWIDYSQRRTTRSLLVAVVATATLAAGLK